MAKRKKKTILRLGDIIEMVVSGSSFAYFQYVNKLEKFGHFIRVFRGTYNTRQNIDNIIKFDDLFQTFLNLEYDLNNKSDPHPLTIIGNAPIPEQYRNFPVFKSDIPLGNGEARWFLVYLNKENEGGEYSKKVIKLDNTLPDEYHNCPTKGIMFTPLLCERILAGATNSYDVHLYEKLKIQAEEEAKQASMKEKSEPNERVSTNISAPSVQQTRAFIGTEFNPLEKAIKKLLNKLDSIAEKYEDIFDTFVREEMFSAIYHGFVLLEHDYKLPESFGMFSKAGNKRVFTALSDFIKDVQILAKREESLQTIPKRLNSFQDDRIQSKNGITYDEYFGEMEKLDEK
ncbi:MAG: hypothetical protein LBU34_11405 [Planctomycetaceae bacterium]|jgi:hypothetical protein|nr:hypothetical protein [Planctomycetaceae bacterium]